MYNPELDNRIEWTIKQIIRVWPEYAPESYEVPGEKYEALKNLFYNKFTDKQIGYFRKLWHDWRVDNIDHEKELKDMIANYIKA